MWIKFLKKLFILIGLIAVIYFLSTTPSYAKINEIKFAIIAPEGSAWMEYIHTINNELKAKTNQQLSLKIYPGGSQGDETDVFRKMRPPRRKGLMPQIHAAAFTGVGLSLISKLPRVLELPNLFESNEEVDFISEKIQPKFEKEFDEKGFKLLGWAEVGFVYIFSKKKIESLDQLSTLKMWVWQGDDFAKAILDRYSVSPIPLDITQVGSSLDSGLIDTFYVSPLAAIAMQWSMRADYALDYKFVNSTGAILINKSVFETLPKDQQTILQEVVKTNLKKLVARTRKDNEESLSLLRKDPKDKDSEGIEFIQLSDQDKQKIKKINKELWYKFAGDYYPKSLIDEIVQAASH